MRNSVLIDDMYHCIICGRSPVQRHHVFGGSLRKLADEDGYWVPLCMEHHTGSKGVHHDREFSESLKESAQLHFEQTHTREAFIRRYIRSYL